MKTEKLELGSSSYRHNIQKIGTDWYLLSWSFDVKIKGSRLRWPRTMTRDTDKSGAERFARKWCVQMPKEND